MSLKYAYLYKCTYKNQPPLASQTVFFIKYCRNSLWMQATMCEFCPLNQCKSDEEWYAQSLLKCIQPQCKPISTCNKNKLRNFNFHLTLSISYQIVNALSTVQVTSGLGGRKQNTRPCQCCSDLEIRPGSLKLTRTEHCRLSVYTGKIVARSENTCSQKARPLTETFLESNSLPTLQRSLG